MPAFLQSSTGVRPASAAFASISAGVGRLDMPPSLFAEMHTVKRILATRHAGGKCAVLQAVMGTDREKVRAWVQAAADFAQMDLTGLARRAGLAPSTLTRFVNAESKFMLSTRTLAKVSRASGFPMPTDVGAAPGATLSDADRIEAVNAVAQVLGVDLPELTPRILRWLDVIEHIPPAAEQNAFELLAGLRQPSRPAEEDASPSEPGRRRGSG